MNPLSDTESEPDQHELPEEKVNLEKKAKKTRKVKIEVPVEAVVEAVEAPVEAVEAPVKKKRVISDEQKAKMQAARKAKAAERKAAKEAEAPEALSPEPVKAKRVRKTKVVEPETEPVVQPEPIAKKRAARTKKEVPPPNVEQLPAHEPPMTKKERKPRVKKNPMDFV